MDIVGTRLRQARKRAHLSLGQVFEYEGIHKGHLSEMERGIKEPTGAVIARLSVRYGCTADYLLGLEPGRDASLLDGLDPTAMRELQALIDELRQLTPAEQRTVLATARTIQRLYEPHIVGEDDAPGDAADKAQ